MGTKDITEKHLVEHNDVFADIANVLLFKGRQVVKAQELENEREKEEDILLFFYFLWYNNIVRNIEVIYGLVDVANNGWNTFNN